MFQRIVEYLRTFRERGFLPPVALDTPRKDGSRNADACLIGSVAGVLDTRPILFW